MSSLPVKDFTDRPDGCGISTSMGVFARWRSSLLQFLPSHQPTCPIPAGSGYLWPSRGGDRFRATVSDQRRRGGRALLTLRGQQLRGLGDTDSLPFDLGRGSILPGRVLHWMVQQTDRDGCGGVALVWACAVHVSVDGTEPNSYVYAFYLFFFVPS